jgi:hypothetical protein
MAMTQEHEPYEINPAQAHLKLAQGKEDRYGWGQGLFGVAIIDPQYEFWPHGMNTPSIREMVIGFRLPYFGYSGIRSRVVFCEKNSNLSRRRPFFWRGKVNRIENRNWKNRYKRSLNSFQDQFISSTTISIINTVSTQD